MQNPKDLIYWGIFVNDQNKKLKTSLSKKIVYPHITYGFKSELPPYILGEETTVVIVGYGNNENNEGYSVIIPDDPYGLSRKLFYLRKIVPHITTSVSDTGRPVDTRDLHFDPIEPFTLTGKFGYFSKLNCVKYSI